MQTHHPSRAPLTIAALLLSLLLHPSPAASLNPPTLPGRLSLEVRDDGTKALAWPRLPSLETNRLLSGPRIETLTPVPASTISGDSTGFTHVTSNHFETGFFALRQDQVSSDALLAVTALNRLAYGSTPGELARILTSPSAIGPQAYIDEQLHFESLPPDPLDVFVSLATNATPVHSSTNWKTITVEGELNASRLFVYLSAPGDAYLDNIAIHPGTGSNIDRAQNLVRNGDFEFPLEGTWNIAPNHAGSHVSMDVRCDGTASLHLVASTAGTGGQSSLWQDISPGIEPHAPVTLTARYLPTTNSSTITIRLAGSGLGASPTNEARVHPTWVYATHTGVATHDRLYILLDGPGSCLIDEIKLVAGTEPEAGINLLPAGDFEGPALAPWTNAAVAAGSFINPTVSRSGNACLNLVFSSGGSGEQTAVVHPYIPGISIGQTYTLSYWYTPALPHLTVALSGAGTDPGNLLSQPDDTVQGIYQQLVGNSEGASLADLRAWVVQHAIGARAQLREVLTQFWENHFVTAHSKSMEFLDRYYDDPGLRDRLAAHFEFREIQQWRQAMANPAATFHDLLVIHAQSPAQIIYLDTVDSRGDQLGAGPSHYVANENYARELLELFCTGVDNGYDQNDIVTLAGAWTGWRLEIVDPENIHNPFAPRSATFRVPDGNPATSNRVGTWSFVYQERFHDERAKTLFPGRTVQPRFGPPWAGRNYELNLPARGGADGLQDGYDALHHLANLPHTQEFISVKLCRLLVHDRFSHGIYDFSDESTLSPEGRLVKQCMLAWESSTPKGRLRPILNTIFNSELFRGQAASMQKIKTPLEYTVSVLRALRIELPDGTFTAESDGYSITGTSAIASASPLSRMGLMMLFDRDDPDGYPEAGEAWISAGTLAERLRFVQTALTRDGIAGKNDGIEGGNHNHTDPVALMKHQLPPAAWLDAATIADYFVRLLYPVEGRVNLAGYRAAAIAFLDTNDNGSPNPLSDMSHTASLYDVRIRGMVALLLALPRFHEQ